jgi:mRNA interferase MazF
MNKSFFTTYSKLKELGRMIIRGEIYYADLSPVVGSEQGGYRPVLVLQNNKGNKFSTTIIVAPISSKMTKNPLPTHVMVENKYLEKKSLVLLEQIRTIDKQRVKEKVGEVDEKIMFQVEQAIKTSLDIK